MTGGVLAIDGGTPIRTGAWGSGSRVDADDGAAILEALRSDFWSSGTIVEDFEETFAAFCGARHCVATVNGTAALRLALLASRVGPGDEVLIPGLTWPSVAVAVLECGATPVCVDIDEATLGLSARAVEEAVTHRTRAIVPTHLFASQCDLQALLPIASRHKLVVIEDCAHVVGTRRFGRALGTFADAGFFSFNQKKVLACGEGGCLVTNDADLYRRAKDLRQIEPSVSVDGALAGTQQLSDVLAALLLSQLRKLPERLLLLEKRAEHLRACLEKVGDLIPLVRLPGTDLQTFYAFCFRVRLPEGLDWFRAALKAELDLEIDRSYRPLAEIAALSSADRRFGDRAALLHANLPGCSLAYAECVRIRHQILSTAFEDFERVAQALIKVATLAPSRRVHSNRRRRSVSSRTTS